MNFWQWLLSFFVEKKLDDFVEDIVAREEKPEDLPVRDVPEETHEKEEGFDWGKVNWLNGCDISKWKVTGDLKVSLSGNKITLDYSNKNIFPAVNFGEGVVAANAWLFVQAYGKFYGSTWEWLRPGQTVKMKSAVDGSHIKMKPMDKWSPQPFDEIWFCVAGLSRGHMRNIEQRTNVVKVVWQ